MKQLIRLKNIYLITNFVQAYLLYSLQTHIFKRQKRIRALNYYTVFILTNAGNTQDVAIFTVYVTFQVEKLFNYNN